MRFKLFFLIAAAGLLAGSCVMEELPVSGGTVRAVIEQEDGTKASVSDQGSFSWSEGDQVWLHTTGGAVVGSLTSGVGTSTAQFSYGAFFGNMTGKAVYPYNEDHSVSGDELNFVLPASYDLGSNLSNTNAALYGVNVDGNIKFNHLAGVMRFILKNVPAGTDSFQVTLDKKINGTFTADLTSEYPVLETESEATESEKTVTLNFTALEEASDLTLYVPLPVGTYNTIGLALCNGEETVWTYSNTVTNTVRRKILILMPAVSLGGSIGGDIENGDDSDNAYIDDSQFNPDLYLRYISNAYYEGNGGAFDYNMYYYSSYIYNSAFALATKVEYKFQLVYLPTSSCYISLIERGDSTYGIYFNSSGLQVQHNFVSWEELGVDPTDVIVMSIEGDTMIINGRSFSFTTIRRGGYIFSGYYYDSDDGVYSKYYSFQDNAKLFYAKGWDADGNLIYLGGPDIAEGPSGNDEACWKSTYYYNNELSTQYHFAYYTENQECSPYGFGNLLGEDDFSIPVTDLSAEGTANSYIVSQSGTYTISPVKGNSSESVGTVSSVEVLWESFGTDETPAVGSLISSVSYEDGKIKFSTPSTYREGNAVIAAKNSSGTILWSWHIWLTDQPQGQVYYNNAGTMMDRNLGATSATPGDVGALGLLYQWGRKDPFLSGASIDSYDQEAESTITWPSAVSSNTSTGTISYSVQHPTTFIKLNGSNYDWYYTGSSSTDNTRWTTSSSDKSIYDPCPVGWRVPDGGSNGVWSKALGSSSYFDGYPYGSTSGGMNFSGKFGSAPTIWYPASGYRNYFSCSLGNVGDSGYYWSASPDSSYAYVLYFGSNGVYPSSNYYRASGQAVRCLQVIN